jgi:MinD-like ATPase involved in chromosome partitioning or flagellar assembly
MIPQDSDVYIVTGAFGSGKTEFALNLAVHLKDSKPDVSLIDLDIVNMYFRSRHRADAMQSEFGVKVLSAHKGMEHADVPALNPAIESEIASPSITVLDLGGDHNGAVVLGRYKQILFKKKVSLIHVFNPYRPYADSVEKIQKLIAMLENTTELKTSLLMANPNLGPETSMEDITEQIPFIKEVAEKTALPAVLMREHKFNEIDFSPSFPIKRNMLLPYEKERGSAAFI